MTVNCNRCGATHTPLCGTCIVGTAVAAERERALGLFKWSRQTRMLGAAEYAILSGLTVDELRARVEGGRDEQNRL